MLSDPRNDFPGSHSPGVTEGPMPPGAVVVAGGPGSRVSAWVTPRRLAAPQPSAAFSLLPLQVMEELQAASVHSDERELLQLLSTPHLRVVTPQSLPTHASVSRVGIGGVLGREAEERRFRS